jgi:hypothetical protein
MFNLHDLQWEPGNYGKGLVTDDNVVTWITDGQWGGPHHSEMVEDSYPPEGWPHAFIINPEGGFEFSLLSDPAEGERLKEIVETADPRLHQKKGVSEPWDDDDWNDDWRMATPQKPKPKPKHKQPYPNVTIDQWEQMKRDWYDSSDGEGKPVPHPFEPEHWRHDHLPHLRSSSIQVEPVGNDLDNAFLENGVRGIREILGLTPFIYVGDENTLFLGDSYMHHIDIINHIINQTGADGKPIDRPGVIYGLANPRGEIDFYGAGGETLQIQNELKNEIRSALGLPDEDEWGFDKQGRVEEVDFTLSHSRQVWGLGFSGVPEDRRPWIRAGDVIYLGPYLAHHKDLLGEVGLNPNELDPGVEYANGYVMRDGEVGSFDRPYTEEGGAVQEVIDYLNAQEDGTKYYDVNKGQPDEEQEWRHFGTTLVYVPTDAQRGFQRRLPWAWIPWADAIVVGDWGGFHYQLQQQIWEDFPPSTNPDFLSPVFGSVTRPMIEDDPWDIEGDMAEDYAPEGRITAGSDINMDTDFNDLDVPENVYEEMRAYMQELDPSVEWLTPHDEGGDVWEWENNGVFPGELPVVPYTAKLGEVTDELRVFLCSDQGEKPLTGSSESRSKAISRKSNGTNPSVKGNALERSIPVKKIFRWKTSTTFLMPPEPMQGAGGVEDSHRGTPFVYLTVDDTFLMGREGDWHWDLITEFSEYFGGDADQAWQGGAPPLHEGVIQGRFTPSIDNEDLAEIEQAYPHLGNVYELQIYNGSPLEQADIKDKLADYLDAQFMTPDEIRDLARTLTQDEGEFNEWDDHPMPEWDDEWDEGDSLGPAQAHIERTDQSQRRDTSQVSVAGIPSDASPNDIRSASVHPIKSSSQLGRDRTRQAQDQEMPANIEDQGDTNSTEPVQFHLFDMAQLDNEFAPFVNGQTLTAKGIADRSTGNVYVWDTGGNIDGNPWHSNAVSLLYENGLLSEDELEGHNDIAYFYVNQQADGTVLIRNYSFDEYRLTNAELQQISHLLGIQPSHEVGIEWHWDGG